MESLVVPHHTRFDIFHSSFFLHMHEIHRYASIAVVSFLCIASLHCIYGFTQRTSKYLILIFYMRDTRWPTPPASGGMGSSPLRSETNAAYLGFFFRKVSVSQASGHGNGMENILQTFWSSG